MVAIGVVLVLMAVGGYLYFRHPRRLTDKDMVVLADFANSTGDTVFDGALRQGLDGGDEAAVGQHRRGDAARKVAQLGHRGGGLLARLADERGRLGPILEAGLGPPELHCQRHQPRLGAIVEVALDPAQLRRLDVQHAPPGPGQLVDTRA